MSDTLSEFHREPKLERRTEHRVEACAHGIPRRDCDACDVVGRWRGARYRTVVECLDVESAVHSVY